jgi:hypothetical protein
MCVYKYAGYAMLKWMHPSQSAMERADNRRRSRNKKRNSSFTSDVRKSPDTIRICDGSV